MANEPRPLAEGFETEYANQLIGTDTLWGGNIGRPEGAEHFIADSYPKAEVKLPEAYSDERANALRAKGGANPDNADMAQEYIKDYGLLEAETRMVEALGSNPDPLRLRYARNIVRACIEKYGPQKVAAAAMHQHGYLDIDTFQETLKQGE